MEKINTNYKRQTFQDGPANYGIAFTRASVERGYPTVWLEFYFHFREEVIMTKWDKLIGMLEARRSTLVGFKDLVGLFREMDGAHGDLQDIEVLR